MVNRRYSCEYIKNRKKIKQISKYFEYSSVILKDNDLAEGIEDNVSCQNSLHTFFKVSMRIAFYSGCSRLCAVGQTLLNVSISF